MEPPVPLSTRLGELALAFQEGDQGAFREIVELMRNRIYALCARSFRDPSLAEDLAQETFIKAFRSLTTLKDPATCEHWLYRIALNLIRDHGRRRSLERRTLEAVGREVPSETTDAAPADEPASERHRRILAAVDELPEHHRTVFVMREIQGLTHERISRELGVPEGTVWSRLSFARRALQQKLRKEVES